MNILRIRQLKTPKVFDYIDVRSGFDNLLED